MIQKASRLLKDFRNKMGSKMRNRRLGQGDSAKYRMKKEYISRSLIILNGLSVPKEKRNGWLILTVRV
ncbi:MAG: hypothetical protein COB67_10370 [SAR324 cluster bacterium]|uniref:Uncharacterized protein n=1 Tax=SAR324 cluster bacterium TaxID=2024889 RepID=A0A2A4SXW8_9DELT|nr:MAG: hypothetical protein COB67_10370 [SAR324 cluster bacterium]